MTIQNNSSLLDSINSMCQEMAAEVGLTYRMLDEETVRKYCRQSIKQVLNRRLAQRGEAQRSKELEQSNALLAARVAQLERQAAEHLDIDDEIDEAVEVTAK